EEEPEVDLTAFVDKQRRGLVGPGAEAEAEEGVDHSLAHIPTSSGPARAKPKPAVNVVEWDPQLEEMLREKQKAEAIRDLKARFKGGRPEAARRGGRVLTGAIKPGADTAGGVEEDETFLDDLLG
ncbi:hypothetical protein CALVIDRAFT_562895, partial [Calocera viscosa TUFC12733]